MDPATILDLVKARLSLSTDKRDTYLTVIISSVITELVDEKGLTLDAENNNQLMFVVDYASWRYMNRDSNAGMPRHLQFRLHNLVLNKEVEMP